MARSRKPYVAVGLLCFIHEGVWSIASITSGAGSIRNTPERLWDWTLEWHTLSCLVMGTLLLTTLPLTFTLPCKMRSSAPRREATPAVASTYK